MTTITPLIYSDIASKLLEQLNLTNDFFNGNICYSDSDICATLTCSVVIFRKKNIDNGLKYYYLENIVPVWWNFTTQSEDKTTLNDFSWSELKQFLNDTI